MKTIWKWPLAVTDRQFLGVPAGAQALTVQVQGGLLKLWALVDPDQPEVRKEIRIIGTGHAIPADPGRYIGTFQMHGGGLVFHAFEDAPPHDEARGHG